MSDTMIDRPILNKRSTQLSNAAVYGKCPLCSTLVTALDEGQDHCDHYLGSFFLDYPYALFHEFPADVHCIGVSLGQFARCLRALLEPLPPVSKALSELSEDVVLDAVVRYFGAGHPQWIERAATSSGKIDEWDDEECQYEIGVSLLEVLSRCRSIELSDLDYHHMAGGSVFALWSVSESAVDELRAAVDGFAVEIAQCALVLEEAR